MADFSYPTSKLRRGRVQGNGQICPTITSESNFICKVEKGGDLNGQHEHRVQNKKTYSARVLALTTPDGLQR